MSTEKSILTFRKHRNLLIGAFRAEHLNHFQQADTLRRQLTAAFDQSKFDAFVLDGAGLVYVISEIFGVLIQARKTLSDSGRQMALCNVEPEVLELLQQSRLDHLFRIHPTLEAAIAAEMDAVANPNAGA